jgi:hypothetical protein
MQKTYTLFYLLLLCLAVSSFRAADWVSFAINERVSVRLPVQPQESKSSKTGKIIMAQDPTGTYLALTTPLGKDFIGQDRDTYYKSIEDGFLEGGTKFIAHSTFVVNSYTGSEFEVLMVNASTKEPMSVFVRVLIVDKGVYVLEYFAVDMDRKSLDRKASQETARSFLDSFTLKPLTPTGK